MRYHYIYIAIQVMGSKFDRLDRMLLDDDRYGLMQYTLTIIISLSISNTYAFYVVFRLNDFLVHININVLMKFFLIIIMVSFIVIATKFLSQKNESNFSEFVFFFLCTTDRIFFITSFGS